MSPEVAALVRSIGHLAGRLIRPRNIDAAHRIPTEVLRGLAELGVFGVTLPTAFGGSGLGIADATEVVTALAQADRSVATTVGLHLGLGTRGLVTLGTPGQQARWLPALAAGDALAAFATTEPNAGSDLSALECVARPHPSGGFALSGTKLYVTNGALCSLVTVTAATPGLGGASRGLSLFLVEPSTPGVGRQREEHKLGLRGSSTTAFIFENCRLPADALMGEPGSGARALNDILAWGRLMLSAGTVGAANTALQLALAHVHGRRQFRKPLIAQEVVQEQLAFAAAVRFSMQSLVRWAARAEGEPARFARLTTSAKVFCSEGAGRIIDVALQLHGGAGYIEDTGLALLARDARVTRIFEGANDVLLTHAGLHELLEPLRGEVPAGVAVAARAVRAGRAALCDGGVAPGVRALNRRAEQHALGRAVVWRDAAIAAAECAQTPGEHAAAELVAAETTRIAQWPRLPKPATATLTAELLEGCLP